MKNGTTCHECRKLEEKIIKQLPKEKSGHKPITEMNTENIEEKNTENNIPNENFGIPAFTQVQNKIVRLFTCLEKALALNDVIVRDFRSSTIPPSPWWLADYPRDIDKGKV